jgi:hypothetical protein
MNEKTKTQYPLIIGAMIFWITSQIILIDLFDVDKALGYTVFYYFFNSLMFLTLFIRFFKRIHWRHVLVALSLFLIPKAVFLLSEGTHIGFAKDLDFRVAVQLAWAILLYGICIWSLRKEYSRKVDVVAW